MLIREWPAILCMATQTELVDVRRSQIVARWSAMGIMAVHTAHLAFPHGVVIGQAELRALGLVTLETGVVCSRPGAQNHVSFRRNRGSRERSPRSRIEADTAFVGGPQRANMNLVTIHAAHVVGGVRPAQPVPGLLTLSVAIQADAVCVLSRSGFEADDFGHVTVAVHVQASGAVTVFALDTLLGVESVPEIAGQFLVTLRAGL